MAGGERRSIAIVTLGCKVNQCDSAAMAESLRRRGWRVLSAPDDVPGGPDVLVVNSCAVTARAAAKSRQAARSWARRFPGVRVVLAGCYPQVWPEEARAIEGVAAIAGTGRAASLDLIAKLLAEGVGAGVLAEASPIRRGLDLPAAFEVLPAAPVPGRVRAFLKVQEGCEAGCTYCIVPRARGSSRSLPLAEAVGQARALVAGGAAEIVLTGIHLSAYGGDLGGVEELADLVAAVAGIEGLRRLRLSSLEPGDVSDRLLAAIAAAPVVCRHLHIPLQSGSDTVLARMGRTYDAAGYEDTVARACRALPGLSLSTDVMVGFPGESEAEFAATVDFVRSVGFMRLHVFPYSARPDTAAATLPGQLARRVKEERAAHLGDIGRQLAACYNRGLVGGRHQVLLEGDSRRIDADDGPVYANEGLTRDYVRVLTRGRRAWPAGRQVMVGVEAADPAGVSGVVVAPA